MMRIMQRTLSAKYKDIYFMELQVIGYWHNFDVSKLNTAYISKSKIDSLKDVEKDIKAGLIFINCVPNRFFGLNIDLLKMIGYITNIAEKSYRIPLKEIKFNQRVLLDGKCDCLENHLTLCKDKKGRVGMAEKDFNLEVKMEYAADDINIGFMSIMLLINSENTLIVDKLNNITTI